MELAALFDHYNDAFMARYGNQLLPVQEQAMNAIRRCRTPAVGEMRIHCNECDRTHAQPLSCGNRGEPALKYLSRYLYRGVISEKNIIADQNGQVTFRYIEGKTGLPQTGSLKGEEFMWLVLQHDLPKGFRRARDYGFLHGNAKKLLNLIQHVLQVLIASKAPRPRPPIHCATCQSERCTVTLIRPAWRFG